MDVSASHCKYGSGSGCESGWTSYFEDQSSVSKRQSQWRSLVDGCEGDEEDDLSMVSDASSGPPHYCEHDEGCCFDDNGCFCLPSALNQNQKSKNKEEVKQHQLQLHNSYLNDTASSPVMKNVSFSKNEASSMEHVMGFSQGFSTTRLKGKSTLKKHFDFLQSSLAGKKGGLKEEALNDQWRL